MAKLLLALLNREGSERALAQAIREDEQAEFQRLVAGIHAAYAPYAAQVEKLVLRGDYDRPVVFGSRAEHLTKVVYDKGLLFSSGYTISPEQAHLLVVKREGARAARIELRIERKFPYQSEVLAAFEPHVPAEHLLERFFQVTMRYLHEDSFARCTDAAT